MTDTPALTTPGATISASADAQLTEADEARRRDPARLSARQLEIFHLVGHGHANREIAALLGVSVKTVEAHKENIKAKLQLPTTDMLAAAARVWLNLRPLEAASGTENEEPHGSTP